MFIQIEIKSKLTMKITVCTHIADNTCLLAMGKSLTLCVRFAIGCFDIVLADASTTTLGA